MTDWSIPINNITKQTLTEFGTLTAEELNWKPNAKSWSIAQNIHHLIVVNETYFPVFTALKAGTYKTPFIANIGFIVTFFGKMIINAVQPNRKKKINTFPIWKPSESNITNRILIEFEKHQNELAQNINELRGLAIKDVVIASPANKYIVYKLETAFDIIISHEQRHIEQAKEILAMLPQNKALYH